MTQAGRSQYLGAMPSLYLIAALSLGAASLGAALWLWRRRQNARVHRRLLRGRSHLLGEEIDQRLASLARLPEREDTDAEVEVVLDEIQILLVERQAHLQTYADLAHLQKVKINLLARERRRALDQVPDNPPPVRPSASSEPLTPPDRDELENVIKAQIEALKPPKKKK